MSLILRMLSIVDVLQEGALINLRTPITDIRYFEPAGADLLEKIRTVIGTVRTELTILR